MLRRSAEDDLPEAAAGEGALQHEVGANIARFLQDHLAVSNSESRSPREDTSTREGVGTLAPARRSAALTGARASSRAAIQLFFDVLVLLSHKSGAEVIV